MGFIGSEDEGVRQIIGSAAGFSLVLAGLKAYFEYGINLKLFAACFPDQIMGRGIRERVRE
jgi:hypothetical protein